MHSSLAFCNQAGIYCAAATCAAKPPTTPNEATSTLPQQDPVICEGECDGMCTSPTDAFELRKTLGSRQRLSSFPVFAVTVAVAVGLEVLPQ